MKRKLPFDFNIQRRSSIERLLEWFRGILIRYNTTRRKLVEESDVLDDILTNFIGCPEYRQEFIKCFSNRFNLIRTDWTFLKVQYLRRSSSFKAKALEYKLKIERALNTRVYPTGSVASSTCCTSSDFDFGIDGYATETMRRKLEYAFKDHRVVRYYNIHKKNTHLQLIKVELKDGTVIDVVGQCSSIALQNSLLNNIDDDQRLIICCVKALLKKLRLIGGTDGKILSCCISVALLCANNDNGYWKDHEAQENSSFFSQFCRYIAEFDFDNFKMTAQGPLPKRSRSSVVEIYDTADPSNQILVTGRTNPETMFVAQLWL